MELNDTLPWDGLPNVGESEDSVAVVIISGDNRVDISVVELNPETLFTEKESDPPHHTLSLSPGLTGEANIPDQAPPEPRSCPVILTVRRGHCLTDLISAIHPA